MSHELTPIIFIPGLMGSLGGEMLGCKTKWGFGMAAWFYKPFIKQLENLGYELNQNLFICYYDWRENCRDIVEQFLLPLLLEVEVKNPNKKVDLLCHSMGGLVGRTYIQGKAYRYNIGNLMVFGTPNKGNIEAYYLWSTGKIMDKANKKNLLFEIIQKGYIWLLSKILNIPLGEASIEKLHENFPGLGDLLPAYDYGYVLCYEDKNANYTYIPNEYIKYKNSFLDNLNKDIALLSDRIKNLYCFVGKGKETNKTLVVDKKLFLKEKKEDFIGSLETEKGDGTVTVRSAKINHSKMFIMEEGHTGILTASMDYIADIYKLDKSPIKKDIVQLKGYPISIIFKKRMSMDLKSDRDIIASFIQGKVTTRYEFIIESFSKDYVWVIFKNLPPGKYVLESPTKIEKDYNIFIMGEKVEKELTYTDIHKMGSDKMKVYFNV